MQKPFELSGRLRSFKYGFQGIWLMLRTQHNAWIHAVITTGVFIAGFWVGLSAAEWCWIVLATASVWTAEALNTAVELVADATTPEFHPIIGQAKDVAAGAVLITVAGAVAIGAIIFWPYIFARGGA